MKIYEYVFDAALGCIDTGLTFNRVKFRSNEFIVYEDKILKCNELKCRAVIKISLI